MLNRIRVVTMLMMVLVIFALLQLTSGGLFFSSLKQNRGQLRGLERFANAAKRTDHDLGI